MILIGQENKGQPPLLVLGQHRITLLEVSILFFMVVFLFNKFV